VGDKSWQESLSEVESQLRGLRNVLAETGSRLNSGQVAELDKVTRRIKLLTYAQLRSQDPEHKAWVKATKDEMSGDGRGEGIQYTREELRKRARVS
jgi:hypothetical protein